MSPDPCLKVGLLKDTVKWQLRSPATSQRFKCLSLVLLFHNFGLGLQSLQILSSQNEIIYWFKPTVGLYGLPKLGLIGNIVSFMFGAP